MTKLSPSREATSLIRPDLSLSKIIKDYKIVSFKRDHSSYKAFFHGQRSGLIRRDFVRGGLLIFHYKVFL